MSRRNKDGTATNDIARGRRRDNDLPCMRSYSLYSRPSGGAYENKMHQHNHNHKHIHVTLYGRKSCPHCKKMDAFWRKQHVSYRYIPADSTAGRRWLTRKRIKSIPASHVCRPKIKSRGTSCKTYVGLWSNKPPPPTTRKRAKAGQKGLHGRRR